MRLLGFDIGGTKCAVIVGKYKEGHITITSKQVLPTNLKISPEEMVDSLCNIADGLLQGEKVDRVGVSCGGPLDSNTGRILGPPNLPGWDDVPIVKLVKEKYNVPVFLQNDANACALAEWKFGNGRGFQNIIFLTFGTGLGAGLILMESYIQAHQIWLVKQGTSGWNGTGLLDMGREVLLKVFAAGVD